MLCQLPGVGLVVTILFKYCSNSSSQNIRRHFQGCWGTVFMIRWTALSWWTRLERHHSNIIIIFPKHRFMASLIFGSSVFVKWGGRTSKVEWSGSKPAKIRPRSWSPFWANFQYISSMTPRLYSPLWNTDGSDVSGLDMASASGTSLSNSMGIGVIWSDK